MLVITEGGGKAYTFNKIHTIRQNNYASKIYIFYERISI